MKRRDLLRLLSAAGIGSAVFGRALVALAGDGKKITPSMIARAEWIAGLDLTGKQRKLMIEGLARAQSGYEKLRAVPLDNGVAPALRLSMPPPPRRAEPGEGPVSRIAATPAERPQTDEDLCFAPITTLSDLIARRELGSVELTRLYLDRLRRYDPLLRCVITLTEELALEQAERADREIAAGRHRGPLHGIPWGAKDLLAVPGYPTTWGATPFKAQVRPEKAAVVSRLEEAGAVLAAKLTLGELARGDVWFGGMTRNPWKTDQGSSGSSAGSAAATAAGLVGFAIGTETHGSIVSPCTRCGVTGLRPTFGRVSRYGAMALAWSMDKIGPIARSVEDCALVFDALRGADGRDASVSDAPFHWPAPGEVRRLRVGYAASLFEKDYAAWSEKDEEKQGLREWQANDSASLQTLREIGIDLVPISLPDRYPVSPLSLIVTAESATAFDELTRSGQDAALVQQTASAWPNSFRRGQLIPAVEYLRANRIRTLLMHEMDLMMEDLDLYVAPTYGGDNLLLTNLTGHPCVVLPNGFRPSDGTPTSLCFVGRLYGETELLALAHAYQQATSHHLKRPSLAPATAEGV